MAKAESFSEVAVEEVKSFWDSQPCNVRNSAKDVGTKEYFDEVEAVRYSRTQHVQRFADSPRWRGKRVLEIGCGIGTDTINFARHGATVTAVDLSRNSVDIATQRTHVYGLQDRVRFFVGDAERLASFVPKDRYDLIYSFGVIHHTPHPDRVLAQLGQYTHPGTEIRLMLYSTYSWMVLWILWHFGRMRLWSLSELAARHSEIQVGSPVTYTFTRGQVRDLLGRHGLRVIDMWADSTTPFHFPNYEAYGRVKRTIVRVVRHFGWQLCITAVPDRTQDAAGSRTP